MKKFIPLLLIIILLIGTYVGLFYVYNRHVNQQQVSFSKTQQDYDTKVLALQKEVSALQDQIVKIGNQASSAALSVKEVSNRQLVAQKSQTSNVTDAVGKNINSAVSVIISQNLPEYQVSYQNPYGNDPFYQGLGLQVPVYVPTGKNKVQEIGAGTGFMVSTDGYILTNKHVVSDSKSSYTVLLYNGKQQTAKVVYLDSKYDLAIIKINGSNYPAVSLGDSSSLMLGQTVVAIGNALGQYNNSVSVGVISGLNRDIQVYDDNGNASTLNGVIQTDAGLNPGNSGGPLLDLNGNVVGINVAEASGSNNISFSIPINIAKTIINNVIKK